MIVLQSSQLDDMIAALPHHSVTLTATVLKPERSGYWRYVVIDKKLTRYAISAGF